MQATIESTSRPHEDVAGPRQPGEDLVGRVRAAATARAVAALVGPFDLDRYATAISPTLGATGHAARIGRQPSARGSVSQ
jgi:hypothetical protein